MAHSKQHTAAQAVRAAAERERKKIQDKIKDLLETNPSQRTQRQKNEIARLKERRTQASDTMKTAVRAGNMSESELREAHDAAMRQRAIDLRSGKKITQSSLDAYAYGDALRGITGRQMGQGTAYTGPGMRIALDEEGK